MNVQLDFFAANDLNGDVIWSTTDEEPYFEHIELRPAISQLGDMKIRMGRDVAIELADAGILGPEVLIRALVPAISETDYWWAMFVTERLMAVIHEKEHAGEDFTLNGPGPLFALDRNINWDEQFSGADAEGFYRVDADNRVVYLANDANIGNFWSRMLVEDGANPLTEFMPFLTRSFDGNDDSAGVPWAASTQLGTEAEPFEMPVGQSWLLDLWSMLDALEDVDALMNIGTVAAPLMRLDLWQSYGADLTGTAFASDVRLFREGVNIATGLTVRGASRKKATHALVMGAEGNYARVTKSGWSPGDYAKAVAYDRPDVKNHGVLERAGRRGLRKQAAGEDEISFGIKPGVDPANGLYFPGFDWLGASVTLKTDRAANVMDYNFTTERLMAIRMQLAEAADSSTPEKAARSWKIAVELNVERDSETMGAERSGRGAGRHSHPPNPKLCPKAVDVLEGLSGSSVKQSSESASFISDKAVDGDDGTHWSASSGSPPVAGEWIAFDLGSVKSGLEAYRLLQAVYAAGAYTGIFDASHAASEFRLYGSEDGDAWTWLPTGKIVADPAANDWTLQATNTQNAPDTGLQGVTAFAARYVLVYAVAGGASDLDVGSIELWQNPHSGISARAARCDHGHAAREINFDPSASGLEATNVQDAIDAHIADHGSATADTVRLDHLISEVPFLIIANRGYNLPDDGNTGTSEPENTRQGYSKCVIPGPFGAAHLIEIDGHINADGSPVAMHDTTVNATTNGTGNVSSKTDAQWAALVIDAGNGFNATRHVNYHPPFIADIFDDASPYDVGFMIEHKGGAVADWVAFFEAQGMAERVIFVTSAANATVAKGLNPNLHTMVNDGAGGNGSADVDWLSVEHGDVTNLAFVTSRAPQRVHAYLPIADIGDDELPIMEDMFAFGVRSWETYFLTLALEKRLELLGVGGSGVADHGALSGLADDDHAQYLNEPRHDLLDHEGLPGVDAGSWVTVDPGVLTVDDSGDDVVLSHASDWGIDGDGPYYESAGATAGDEAALMYDPTNDQYVLVPYNP